MLFTKNIICYTKNSCLYLKHDRKTLYLHLSTTVVDKHVNVLCPTNISCE